MDERQRERKGNGLETASLFFGCLESSRFLFSKTRGRSSQLFTRALKAENLVSACLVLSVLEVGSACQGAKKVLVNDS